MDQKKKLKLLKVKSEITGKDETGDILLDVLNSLNSSIDNLNRTIADNKVDVALPDEIKISNLGDITEDVQVKNWPKEMPVKVTNPVTPPKVQKVEITNHQKQVDNEPIFKKIFDRFSTKIVEAFEKVIGKGITIKSDKKNLVYVQQIDSKGNVVGEPNFQVFGAGGGGAGGVDPVGLKNVTNVKVNPATEDKQIEISAKLDPATDIETQNLITVGTTAVEITFANTKGVVVLCAADNNSAPIFIGKSDVGNNGDKQIATLLPGQTRAFPYDDSINALYARSTSFNQKLSAALYLGAGPVTFDGVDSRIAANLISASSSLGSIVNQFVKTDYVSQGGVLVRGGVDFILDNLARGYDKVRKSSNEITDQINGGGDWYGCSGRDLASSGGVVSVDISRPNLDHEYRALESVKFIIRNDINTPETGVVKITVMGFDSQIGAYVPKAFTCLDINQNKMTDKDTYICGMTPTVMTWHRDDSRYGFILFEDIGGTLGSRGTTIEVLLEDYSFNRAS